MDYQSQSDQINELAAALAKAQGEFKRPEKSKKGNYGYYCTLDDYVDAVKVALSKNGLSIAQPISTREDGYWITTKLLHASGQWMLDSVRATPEKGSGTSELQAAGKGFTYIQKYALRSMLCIGGGEDDNDGEATPTPVKYNNAPKVVDQKVLYPEQEAPVSKIFMSPEELTSIEEALEGHKDIAETLLGGYKVDSFTKVERKWFYAILKRINELKTRMA